MAESDGCSYFRRTGPFWMVIVSIYIILHTWTAFWPQDVPYGLLGPLGALAKYFVDYHYPDKMINNDDVCLVRLCFRWFLMFVIHVCEVLFALKLCSDKGIDSTSARLLWVAQTFLFGLGSLGLLIKYKPDGRPKRQ
ncbi:transmembrane protein 254-like [Cyprinus carpio]|uniref:Transmembrane protein 254 n=1 Tax=Cyprinus carpio TaxID=7962 RepID=A0A9R0B8K4_CYPCA|nr:transmembrane protein 254-like [Cyprinus carpio]